MDEYKIELSPSMMIFEREVVVELIAAVSGFCFRKWTLQKQPVPEYINMFITRIERYRETALHTDSLEELWKIKYQAKLVKDVLEGLDGLH